MMFWWSNINSGGLGPPDHCQCRTLNRNKQALTKTSKLWVRNTALVKQRRARSIIGWLTTWDNQVLYTLGYACSDIVSWGSENHVNQMAHLTGLELYVQMNLNGRRPCFHPKLACFCCRYHIEKLGISCWLHCVPNSLYLNSRYTSLSKVWDSQLVYIIHPATETGNCVSIWRDPRKSTIWCDSTRGAIAPWTVSLLN